MKKLLLLLASGVFLLGNQSYSQTAGTLTVTFSQPQPSSPSGTKNVIAVWIENNSGTFIKTKLRYVGNGTKDHLPSWAVKAGGTASNATSTTCNTTDATTGATLTSSTSPTAFGTKTVVWDGKNVNGTTNGTTVADGVYKVWIESSWSSGTASNSHNDIISFTFTKGATADHQTPAGDNYFNTITLDWVPSGTGIDNNTINSNINIYPNPTNGIVNIDLSKIQSGSKIQIYSIVGKKVYEEITNKASGVKSIDLSEQENGVYLVSVNNKTYKILLNQ